MPVAGSSLDLDEDDSSQLRRTASATIEHNEVDFAGRAAVIPGQNLQSASSQETFGEVLPARSKSRTAFAPERPHELILTL